MSLRRAWRLALAAVLAGVSVPLATASPAAADDAASVHIDAPAEMEPGEQYTISVTVTVAEPIAAGDSAYLTVMVPDRLTLGGVEGGPFNCEVLDTDGPPEYDCFLVDALSGSATVDIAVLVGSGAEAFGNIDADFQTADDRVTDSVPVHVPATESPLHLTIDGPDRVEFGEEFTVEVTARTDRPEFGTTSFLVNLDHVGRLIVEDASAPGYTCSIREFEDQGGGVVSSAGADCNGPDLTDTATLILTLKVGPGPAMLGSMDVLLLAGDGRASEGHSFTIMGSLPTTTISGRVWNDVNRDGRQDPGEPGIEGVTVGGQFSVDGTGPDGRYELDLIEVGTPVDVRFDIGDKLEFTKANVGDDDGDSDVVSNQKDCEACNVGHAPVTVSGPTTVDAGAFDPNVPPDSDEGTGGGSDSPRNEADRNLANTGVPTATLVGIGAALLAAGTGLTMAFRRRRLSRTTAG